MTDACVASTMQPDELVSSLKNSLDAGTPYASLDGAQRQLQLALQLALVAGVRMQELEDQPDLAELISELGGLMERYGPEAIAAYVVSQGGG